MTVFFSFSVAACILSARSPRARLSASQGIPAPAGPDSGGGQRHGTHQDSALIRAKTMHLFVPRQCTYSWPPLLAKKTQKKIQICGLFCVFLRREVWEKSQTPRRKSRPEEKKNAEKTAKGGTNLRFFCEKKQKKSEKRRRSALAQLSVAKSVSQNSLPRPTG